MFALENPIFEWDAEKNRKNIEKHGFGFQVAARALLQDCFIYASNRNDEIRYVAVTKLLSRTIAITYTIRHEKIRIISARYARKKEKVAYRQLYD